jgi:hypothetical protein
MEIEIENLRMWIRLEDKIKMNDSHEKKID